MPDGATTEIFGTWWAALGAVAVVLLAAAELGVRLGTRLHTAKDEARKEQIGGIHAAVLGMLGLLLGFTFAMGVDRYDRRRGLVLQEANAIGTTYLRAELLPAAQQAPVRELLRDYVDVRLKYRLSAHDPESHADGFRESDEIQQELWRHAREAALAAPNDITATFIESLNETIDTDAERRTAMRARIPGGVWFTLTSVAAIGCFTGGYGAGASGARNSLSSVLMPVMITCVFVLVFDLMHPRQGFIGVSQQPLIDLQHSMERDTP